MGFDVEPSPLEPTAPSADPERVVVECCAAGTPAVVTFHDQSSGLRAAFASFRNERIELEMTDDPAAGSEESAVCHVSFLYRGRPVVFTAPLRQIRRDGPRAVVTVGLPGSIQTDGVRSAFRVPGGEPPPEVELVADDGVAWKAGLVNVSLTGMLLRLPCDGPTLMPDQVVEVSIRLNEDFVRLAGVVRRVEQDCVGVFFPDAVSDAPENPARRVVAALERRWHAHLR